MIAAVSTVTFVACGGDDTTTLQADAATNQQGGSSSTIVATTTADVESSLPSPDAAWAAQVSSVYAEYLEADLDRTLPYIEGLDAAPEREVELYATFLRSTASAIDTLLAEFPTEPAAPDLEALLKAFSEELEANRDLANEVADQLDAEGEQIQADLDDGGSQRYSELREMMGPAGERTHDACFALQAEIDQRQLGALTCIPGPPDAGGPTQAAEAQPSISLGPDAGAVVLEFVFNQDSLDPEGGFSVVEGAEQLGCTSGTWVDTDLTEDTIQLTKLLTCTNGDRTGTITAVQWFDGSDTWTTEVADGDFVGIAGVGNFSFDPDTVVETWTGEVGFSDG